MTPKPPHTQHYLTDPDAWRALAHPMRMRLLHELGRLKTARAADLAEALDEPANSVSFHLRQLARYALIEPAGAEGGDRRERWWRVAMTDPALRLDDSNDSPASRDALRGVVEMMRTTNHQLVDDFIDAISFDDTTAGSDGDIEPTNWDISFDLTPEDWKQLKKEIFDVISRWREHSSPAADRETYQLVGFGANRRALQEARHRRDQLRHPR